jgi:HAD superfamily hydrolase (TIGR01509 family)
LARTARLGRNDAGATSASHVAYAASNSSLEALIFDCDGVILESEHLHRTAYNMAFVQFGLQIGGENVVWTEDFYDILQNTVGGGKPKMRWFFGRDGWPHQRTVCVGEVAPPETPEHREALIDALQDYKTQAYKDLIANCSKPRPGVLRLMEEAKSAGIFVAVCSAATKTSVEFTLNNLLGEDQFKALDCFLAGDDVSNKKPDPEIYITASKKLDVHPDNCIVVEDSTIGLNAALGAGMDCVVTYTKSTASETFEGAKVIVSDLGEDASPKVTLEKLIACKVDGLVEDDRVVTVNE